MDLELIKRVQECAYQVRKRLLPGYFENVYQNALMIELKKASINAEAEVDLKLFYDGIVIGSYRADIIVEKKLILELKAVSEISSIHEFQLVNYLQITGYDMGVLINYGAEKFSFKLKFRTTDLLFKYQQLKARESSRFLINK